MEGKCKDISKNARKDVMEIAKRKKATNKAKKCQKNERKPNKTQRNIFFVGLLSWKEMTEQINNRPKKQKHREKGKNVPKMRKSSSYAALELAYRPACMRVIWNASSCKGTQIGIHIHWLIVLQAARLTATTGVVERSLYSERENNRSGHQGT